MPGIDELLEAIEAGRELTTEHRIQLARWLRWSRRHYPLVYTFRASLLAEGAAGDPCEPLLPG